jgi:putative ABC transport system permease protein
MSLWSRVANVFRSDRLNREIAEEFESHLAEAMAEGRDPEEAQRALGSALRQSEASHDIKVVAWLDSLRADAVFGWRQLKRNKVTSGAAILSLALAMGACISAFRLIDALLLRPLPVSEPGRLHVVSFNGFGLGDKPYTYDSCSYPMFRKWRATIKNDAELIAISYAEREDLTYGSDEQTEKAYLQYVSGWMFSSFGLQPAAGRLLTEGDDLEPGKHPYAVLSYDYWKRRFGSDPNVVGRTFRKGTDLYEIVGVAAKGFTGTEPGTVTDVFLPTMMQAGSIYSANSFWLRAFVRPKPGVAIGPLRDQMYAVFRSFEQERAKTFTNFPKSMLEGYPKDKLVLLPAAQGASQMQGEYREALGSLGALVLLVLIIACVNVANLMTALAAARSREMALRVSIGAGRRRLVQMVMVESAILALFAIILGVIFAWWSAPFVVSMINPPDNPARLILSMNWRVLGFGIALVSGVTLLFGFLPALRASSIQPISALKGGDDNRSRRRLMYGTIALQVTFCFVVLFVTGLFVSTLRRLSDQPIGFSPKGVLLLETVTRQDQPPVVWQQVADDLRTVSGVGGVALSQWPLMSGTMSNNFISIHNAPPSTVLAFFLGVSPGWMGTMKMPLIDGRDFRTADANPQVAIVNQTFAKQFFPGENPVGKSFRTAKAQTQYEIVGVTGDAIYRNLREPMLPVVYVPLRTAKTDGTMQSIGSATFAVRTSGTNPLALAPALRREVSRARSELRVSNIRTQEEIIDGQTIRERLLAMLAVFFAGVALLLAGIGLYGVLNYSVLQRHREIGIRLAIGAPRAGLARLLTIEMLCMVAIGVAGGMGLGLLSARYLESLLFHVRVGDPAMLALPSLVILTVVLFATIPAILRALRIDPAEILRTE